MGLDIDSLCDDPDVRVEVAGRQGNKQLQAYKKLLA
jgi:hypothetical protein